MLFQVRIIWPALDGNNEGEGDLRVHVPLDVGRYGKVDTQNLRSCTISDTV